MLQSDLSDLVRIEDPAFYVENPYPVFDRMRVESPLHYYEPLDTFVITRWSDIREVVRKPLVFSNQKGIFLNDIKFGGQTDSTLTDAFFPKGGEQIATTDPPRHRELRRVLGPVFSGEALDRMSGPMATYSDELLDQITPGKVTDWMSLAAILPIRVGSLLIGLPDTDVDRVRHWADELEKVGGDLDFEAIEAAIGEFSSLREYIVENFEEKRSSPGEDLLSHLLKEELDDEKISEANVVMFAMTMLGAGGDTTRALLAGMVMEFANNPDQWTLLRNNRDLISLAFEESMRWVSPARGFIRYVTEDTELRGKEIKAGQYIYLVYTAGNFDPEVFKEPGRFDITRAEATSQLGFGAGPHVCAGARLVRVEVEIMLNKLLDRYERFELAAEPKPVMHVVRNSWEDMPIIFHEG